MWYCQSAFAIALLSSLARGQNGYLRSQNFTFNSTFALTPDQISKANLTDQEANNFEVALNFERSNYAGGSVYDDPFYATPENFDPANPPPPGTILKVEQRTNTSLYTIPPSVSMSRILYTSESLNGTSIPASAYILWPYIPRTFSNLPSNSNNTAGALFPLVGLAHGTSGQTAECAPSHIRYLWDGFHEPFTIALQGYAVVAPDYAGTGAYGGPIPYFVLPSQANDLAHAVAAAQSAFPSLSRDFVIMGHSHGGGTAWAFAQRQAARPMLGYLGTVAASPFTDILDIIEADAIPQNNARVVGIAQGLDSVLPSFKISDWVTDLGVSRRQLLQEVRGCSLVGATLASAAGPILKDGWQKTPAADFYRNVSDNGRRPFAGPMLVLQGDIDANANVDVNAREVNATCDMFPENSLHYIQYANISHVPTLYVSQYLWLDWIRDRFNGVSVEKGCVKESRTATNGVPNGAGQNWVIEYDKYGL